MVEIAALKKLLSEFHTLLENVETSKEYRQRKTELANEIFLHITQNPPFSNLPEFINSDPEILPDTVIAALFISEHNDTTSIKNKIEFLDILLPDPKELTDIDSQNQIHCQVYDLGTPLDLAIQANSLELVKFLVEKKNVSLDEEQFKSVAYHIDLILHPSSQWNIPDQGGQAKQDIATKSLDILHYLIGTFEDNLRCLEIMIGLNLCTEEGKSLLEREESLEWRQNQPDLIYKAAKGGHQKVTQHLLENILQKDFNINSLRMNNRTLISYAAENGHLEVVQYLIKKGADCTITDNYDKTPLHYAAAKGHLGVLQHLVEEKGADCTITDLYGKTPLHYAAENGHLEVLQHLLNKGADPNCEGEYNRTPLHYAAENGHLGIVKYLVEEKGAGLSCKDILRKTPLHYAAEKGHLGIVKYLVEEKGADCTITDLHDKTPLHYAAEEDHLEVVQYLLINKGANPNCKDYYGRTPLHYAGENGCLEVVKYLLNDIVQCLLIKDADCTIKDYLGRTPLDLATKKGHTEAVQILKNKAANSKPENHDGQTPFNLSLITKAIISLLKKDYPDIPEETVSFIPWVESRFPRVVPYLAKKLDITTPPSATLLLMHLVVRSETSQEFQHPLNDKQFINQSLTYIKRDQTLNFEQKQKYLSIAVKHYSPQFKFIDFTWWKLQFASFWINCQAYLKPLLGNSTNAQKTALYTQENHLSPSPNATSRSFAGGPNF